MSERRSEKREEKVLAWLIIIAVLISITSTFFSFNMLNELEDYKNYFTGYGTKAQVNITISQNLTITVIQTNMSFGIGQVVSGRDNATINSTTKLPTITTDMLTAANWSNTSVFNPLSIVIRNEGNVNNSINLTSNKDASTFIGGTSPSFQYISADNETDSCLNGLVASFTEVQLGDGINGVCTNLSSGDTKDEVKIEVLLVIPNDAYGEKECDWNFTATPVVES